MSCWYMIYTFKITWCMNKIYMKLYITIFVTHQKIEMFFKLLLFSIKMSSKKAEIINPQKLNSNEIFVIIDFCFVQSAFSALQTLSMYVCNWNEFSIIFMSWTEYSILIKKFWCKHLLLSYVISIWCPCFIH